MKFAWRESKRVATVALPACNLQGLKIEDLAERLVDTPGRASALAVSRLTTSVKIPITRCLAGESSKRDLAFAQSNLGVGNRDTFN